MKDEERKRSEKIEKLKNDKKIDDVEWVRLSCWNSITMSLTNIGGHLNTIRENLNKLIDNKVK